MLFRRHLYWTFSSKRIEVGCSVLHCARPCICSIISSKNLVLNTIHIYSHWQNIDDFLPYLPIIVECCWTAASRSLSSIVHSPISVHPETGAHSTSHSIRAEKTTTLDCFLFIVQWARLYLPKTLSTVLPCFVASCFARESPGDPTFTCLPVRSAD